MKSTIILYVTPFNQLSEVLSAIVSLRYSNITSKQLRTIQNIVNNVVYFLSQEYTVSVGRECLLMDV
jgi:hypothetical protein